MHLKVFIFITTPKSHMVKKKSCICMFSLITSLTLASELWSNGKSTILCGLDAYHDLLQTKEKGGYFSGEG